MAKGPGGQTEAIKVLISAVHKRLKKRFSPIEQ